MSYLKKFYLKRFSGFTLVEAIITMLILAFTMTAALYLLSSIILMTERNEKRLIGTYLAQECVELVRNVRDTAWKQRLPWDWAFRSTSSSPLFIIEPDHTGAALPVRGKNLGVMVKEISDTEEAKLYLDGASYTHTQTGTETLYKRMVKVERRSDTLAALKCTVEWDYHGEREAIEIGTLLTNWYK